MDEPKTLTNHQSVDFIEQLKNRFIKHTNRHSNLLWAPIEERLLANPHKLWSLFQMDRTGGEPDVVKYEQSTNTYWFVDCSPESPIGRRSVCYDREGQEQRKEHRPDHNATDMANEMGVVILNEQQYRELQTLGTFDTKTSSWIQTPHDIRQLGGALFADYRYGHVFVYHNGAQSYYAARGFRTWLKV
jgi:hypothetical protein